MAERTRTRRPSKPAPMSVTLPELRTAIAAVFYPSMPSWDLAGQDRIDRATRRVADVIEARR